MTAISILRVDFREIGGIVIRCGCAGEISLQFPRKLPQHLECPSCGRFLWSESQGKLYGRASALV